MVTVITGSSMGLGFHAASYLARASPSTDIVFACRDVSKARAAAASIVARHSHVDPSRLIVLDTPLQLADLESVRSYGALFILVCAASVKFTRIKVYPKPCLLPSLQPRHYPRISPHVVRLLACSLTMRESVVCPR
jgi:NAD(P)-dependent dehydrogenase (short-subunit alcohol dehydrogenase family)